MPATSCQAENQIVFVDRRTGKDRRIEQDRCKNMNLDLFHRKRRKSSDRRATNRTLAEDYMAFSEKQSDDQPYTS